jgi:hypothetical protein
VLASQVLDETKSPPPDADARNAAGAIVLVRDIDWPPRVVTMRVLNVDRHEVHSVTKGDGRTRG